MTLSDDLKVVRSLHNDVRRVRILTLDIETKPAEAYVWGMFNQNLSLSKVIDPGGMISFGAKFLGEKTQHYSVWEDGYDAMVEKCHDLLSEADVVVTFNGRSFDHKVINWAFAQAGLPRPRPYKTIDLYRVVKQNFRPLSGKLDHVADMLGLGRKLQHEGMDLWVKVMNGDNAAQKRFEKYCRRDVELTEKLYLRLLPWLPSGVNLPLIANNDTGCPICGSPKLKSEGDTTYTAQTGYVLYSCPRCRAWVRSSLVKHRTSRRIVR